MISTTRTVPRIAAIAFGVRISITSPGRMRCRTTPIAILPAVRSTLERPVSSLMVRDESSRPVTSALPPSSTRTTDFSAVAM